MFKASAPTASICVGVRGRSPLQPTGERLLMMTFIVLFDEESEPRQGLVLVHFSDAGKTCQDQ